MYYGFLFDVFTFTSLNWLYDLFYADGRMRILPELINYLTFIFPLTFLIMDDRGWVETSKSVRISSNNFTALKWNYCVRYLRLNLI